MHVRFDSERPESTMESPDVPLTYRVVDGEVIAELLPQVVELYERTIPELALSMSGIGLVPSRFPRSSVTLNLLEGLGARYELHVDSNSITGLLFASTLADLDGGALRLHYPGSDPIDVVPREGMLLLYDARWVPHEVLPLQRDVQRLSLPMNYFLPTDIEQRPAHLDSYIFGTEAKESAA
jgi:hypothetical protein